MEVKKIDLLREDLKLQIQELKVTPGSILILSPKSDDHIMTDTYMNFVAETLSNIIGPQVKFLILPHNQLRLEHKDAS